MDIWEKYKNINEELKKDFLCIPPYLSVTGKFVGDLVKSLKEKNYKEIKREIVAEINNPWQRAFQIEYMYKKCDIFKPFIKVIEYAMYDLNYGNWICAYMTLLPIVEAVLRKWSEEQPELSFGSMRGFVVELTKYLEQIEFYSDDRINITDAHIEYLQFVLCEVFYTNIKSYKNKNFSWIFNRNVTLHTLEGVTDEGEVIKNLCSILLILDIIANLYMMRNPKYYWENTFYAIPEENDSFKLRWSIYKLIGIKSIVHSDLNILRNMLLYYTSKEEKKNVIKKIENEIERIDKIELRKIERGN